MQTSWKLSFTAKDSAAAEAALEAFGATLWATTQAKGGTRFEVYFDGQPDLTTLDLPADAKQQLAALPDKDWVAESQSGLPPVVAPPFHLHGTHDTPRRGGWRNIEMQAGAAFGTGHHGTTLGCLMLLADMLKQHTPRRVADIGCGSGVLAITAAKAGCHAVLASDNDPLAVAVACENARLNHVAPRIRCFTATGMAHPTYHGRRFDLILANILAAPLRHLASDFDRHLSPRGRVIVAGLMDEQARAVIARYRGIGLLVEQKISIGAWTSLCFKR